jgi:hypothetical protein
VDPSQFRRIDAVCDAFEAELLAGKRPAIEERVTLVPEGDRERLRADLFRVQVHYLKAKQQRGLPRRSPFQSCPATRSSAGKTPPGAQVDAAARLSPARLPHPRQRYHPQRPRDAITFLRKKSDVLK